jgi:hypothetical protein
MVLRGVVGCGEGEQVEGDEEVEVYPAVMAGHERKRHVGRGFGGVEGQISRHTQICSKYILLQDLK